jgi:hypothetical protein
VSCTQSGESVKEMMYHFSSTSRRIFCSLSSCLFRILSSYYMPGDDNGSFEDPFNTWEMFVHSKNIQVAL